MRIRIRVELITEQEETVPFMSMIPERAAPELQRLQALLTSEMA